MVAKTPTKEKRTAVSLNSNLLRETVKKMDRCMARLQELQYTVTGGNKVIAGISLSPRSTKVYLRTSLRCKQESLRIKNTATRVSPVGKMHDNTGEWRRMSLPAMLVRETVVEILQASRFAKEVATAVAKANQTAFDLSKTPETGQKKNRPHFESTQLQARRRLEKQGTLQFIQSESNSPTRRRVRSRITFKVSPKKKTELGKENQHLANRVSPKNRPWAKKTVLFPNPLFLSSPSSHQHKFCKTRSPVIGKMQQTPHKFAIKSHPTLPEFRSKIRNPAISLSPTRQTISKLPKLTATNTASKLRLSFSPSKLRRSFSPSKLANRLVSPLKNRISVQKSGGLVRGMKHRPSLTPIRFSGQRI